MNSLQTVGSVDAAEARVPDPTERQTGTNANIQAELIDVMPERIRRASSVARDLPKTLPPRP